MATTLTNTTFLFLCASLIVCLVRYAKHGEDDAPAWVRKILQGASGSKIFVGILILGAAIGLVGHLVLGSLGTGDLFQDYVGAKELAAGRSINPPDMRDRVDYWLAQEGLTSAHLSRWGPLRRLQTTSIAQTRVFTVQPHPPFHILLILPLVELFGTAQRFYFAISIITLIAYAWMWVLLWRSTSLPAIVPAGALALLGLLAIDWQPLLANLREGQIHTLVAFLVVGAWYLLKQGRSWPAGVLIGLAALIKMFPALLIFWLLLRKRRAFVAALATVIVMVVFLYLLRGPGAFLDYWHTARSWEATFGRGRQNYSLSSVIPYIVAGPTAKSFWASAAVALSDLLLFGYTAYLTLSKRSPTSGEEALEFSGYIVLACLLSPTVEAFYYPILLLPIAVLASGSRAANALRTTILLLAILWCFSSPEQVIWRPMQFLVPMIGDRLAFLIFSLPTFAMLGLWYWIIIRQRVSQQSPAVAVLQMTKP